jgi:hypothetical protein
VKYLYPYLYSLRDGHNFYRGLGRSAQASQTV